ncbi:MAG: hypothetical protein QOG33_846 [Gaiellales bacterium]|nr:hypothetical protein [Gaiellales bacterium]
MKPRAWLVAAALAGLAAGLLVAIAAPRESARAPRVDALVQLPGQTRAGDALAPLPREPRLKVLPASIRRVLTAADPSGGAPWVIRSFDARQSSAAASLPVRQGPTLRCVQLLRLLNGREGWIDGANTLRPPGAGIGTAPLQCTTRLPGAIKPFAVVTTLLAQPSHPAPTIRGSVVWGLTQSPPQQVELLAGADHHALRVSAAGGFIAFLGPATSRIDIRLVITRPGASESLRFDGSDGPAMPPSSPRPVLSRARIGARAPDPAGGPAWGLAIAPTSHGGWCVGSPGQLAGDQIGTIDERLGTIEEQMPRLALTCPVGPAGFSHRRPLVVGQSGGASLAGDQAPDPGRALLRTLPGRTTVYGITRPDVTLLTISTPRDVRTVAPSKNGHAFLVVYDGVFAAGRITITAKLADGTTTTSTMSALL